MELIPQLERDIGILKEHGFKVEVVCKEGEQFCVIIRGYPLSTKMFNMESSDLLIIVPPVYPNAKLDMFWTDQNLRFINGDIPPNAEQIQDHCGSQWRTFSRHPQVWNPARDNIITYLEFIEYYLKQKPAK